MFQITGNLVELTPITSGTSAQGNTWQRNDAIVEVQDGQYVTTYALQVFNKDITIPVGTAVVVDFYIKSRPYNGKWFTSLHLARIEPAVQQQVYQPAPVPQYNSQGYQQPMQQQGYKQRPPQMPAQPVKNNTASASQSAYQKPQMPPMPTAPIPPQSNSVDDMGDLPF